MLVPKRFEDELAAHKQAGVLQEVRPESLPAELVKLGDLGSINLIVLSCCDGHQFMDITQHTKACCESAKSNFGLNSMSNDCFHWKTENGGPYALSIPALRNRVWRDHTDKVDVNILASMEQGMSLKKLNVALLIGHAVCGAAKDHLQSLQEYEDHLARAKDIIMSTFGLPRTQVLGWLQLHRHVGRKTHHLDFSRVRERPTYLSLAHAA